MPVQALNYFAVGTLFMFSLLATSCGQRSTPPSSAPPDEHKAGETRLAPLAANTFSLVNSADGRPIDYVGRSRPPGSVGTDGRAPAARGGIHKRGPNLSPAGTLTSYVTRKAEKRVMVATHPTDAEYGYSPAFFPDSTPAAQVAVQVAAVPHPTGTSYAFSPALIPADDSMAGVAPHRAGQFFAVDPISGVRHHVIINPAHASNGDLATNANPRNRANFWIFVP